MRPRLRRLMSLWRKPERSAARPAETERLGEIAEANGRGETERRLAEAQRRLKHAVPPREE
jgi:hypothetical protein